MTTYRDSNFRKTQTHMLKSTHEKTPAVCYSYETRSKLYDIIVTEDGRAIIRINSRKAEVGPTHREIDKFFNLALDLT
jgi:hypothetical protein